MYAADVGGSGPGGVLSDEEMARALQRQFDEEAAMIEAEERLRDMVSTHTHTNTHSCFAAQHRDNFVFFCTLPCR
jgi:hypothetical protein